MQIYLVGGAVRDRLLGRIVSERDYVVVGGSSEEMLALGYRQVGRDFPVFLHPQTHEEYALARTQRGHNHQPGKVVTGPGVTLEEDLGRRDLTINAIAEDESGALIDPYNGVDDLRNGLLRHVSDTFAEDPIRVLRLARFMARYSDWHFKVATETGELISKMAESGDLDSLVPERVWQELIKALGEKHPDQFFLSLRELGVLGRLFPEIEALWGVPQPTKWHPEVDCGIHTMLALRVACEISEDLEVRFATLTHDLGKGQTPKAILPSHHGHESLGAELVDQFCQRLKAPSRFRDLAQRCATYHSHMHRLYELKPKTLFKLFKGLDAFRKHRNLAWFTLVCQADFQGRQGFEQRDYPQGKDLINLFKAALAVVPEEVAAGRSGAQRGEAIRRAQIGRIAEQLTIIKQQRRCSGLIRQAGQIS
jgi:tRNA nucleotidyltransferase (CCA-adding enzyme)